MTALMVAAVHPATAGRGLARKGRDLYQASRFAEARLVFQEALKANPADHQARLWLAYTELALDDLESALRHFEPLEARFSSDPEYLFAFSETYTRRACQLSNQLAALGDRSARAQQHLAYRYKAAGQSEKALDELRRAVQLRPRMAGPRLDAAVRSLNGRSALGALLMVALAAAGSVAFSSSPVSPRFVDVAAQKTVAFRADGSPTSRKYLLESMVGGVALFDYDGDGRLDLFFVNGAKLTDPMPPGGKPDKTDPRYWNRLYRNTGEGAFKDVTDEAGVRGHSFGMGAAAGDYDNDGKPDLYVTNFGRNILYHNEGGGRFADVTERAGVPGGGWSSGAAFLDYDNDGHIDLVVARYVAWDFKDLWCGERRPEARSYCHPDHFAPVSHILYRNNGDGTFADVSQKSGLAAKPGKGLGVAIQDFDRDGWTDIVVANDSFPQQLFRNKGKGTFEEIGLTSGVSYDDDGQVFAGMGVDFADYDNDGWPDVFVNALGNQRYALFRNVKRIFEYVSGPAGVGRITMLHSGWGTRFLDYDNDGWKDLFVAQGHVMDNIQLTQPSLRYLEPLLLMKNDQGRFSDVSAHAGEAFRAPRAARGAAFGDLDNDGFIDVAVNCLGQNALVLRNSGVNGNHWIVLDPVGTISNRDGIGARLRLVTASGREQHGFVTAAGSYLSSSDRRVHFGIGADTVVKFLEIAWPSGTIQRLENLKADQILKIKEPAAR